jgi:hypothetical protein
MIKSLLNMILSEQIPTSQKSNMSDILDQSTNLRPVSTNTAKKLNKSQLTAANSPTLNSSNGSVKRANSAKSKLGLVKNSRRPIVTNPIIEYNSVAEIPINERKALYSTWTPLSDETANQKVRLCGSLVRALFLGRFLFELYDERKLLVNKWFESWNDKQRKLVIDEIFNLCKPKQLIHAKSYLNRITPTYHLDFTRILPRVISLYIFSFLDPKSLSESAKVCRIS